MGFKPGGHQPAISDLQLGASTLPVLCLALSNRYCVHEAGWLWLARKVGKSLERLQVDRGLGAGWKLAGRQNAEELADSIRIGKQVSRLSLSYYRSRIHSGNA